MDPAIVSLHPPQRSEMSGHGRHHSWYSCHRLQEDDATGRHTSRGRVLISYKDKCYVLNHINLVPWVNLRGGGVHTPYVYLWYIMCHPWDSHFKLKFPLHCSKTETKIFHSNSHLSFLHSKDLHFGLMVRTPPPPFFCGQHFFNAMIQ